MPHQMRLIFPSLATMLVCLWLAPGGMAASVTPLPTPAPLEFQGQVETPGGKPVANASVVLNQVDLTAHTIIESATTQTGADGAYDVRLPAAYSLPLGDRTRIMLVCTTPASVAVIQAIPVQGVKSQTVVMQPFTQVRVRFLNAQNHPIAHLQVTPRYFFYGQTFGPWDKAVSPVWTVTTDAQGFATWTRLPQGAHMQLGVDDARFARLDYHAQIMLANRPVTSPQTMHLLRGGTVTGIVRYQTTGLPAAGIVVVACPAEAGNFYYCHPTGRDGRFQIMRLPPGSYSLQLQRIWQAPSPWTAAAQMVTVKAGGDVTASEIQLEHGGLLTGKVTDQVSGKPVPGVNVEVHGPSAPPGFHIEEETVSGPDGSYTLRVSPGVQTIQFYSPGAAGGLPQQSVTVAYGQTKTLNVQMPKPVPPLSVQGVVVGPDGKPVAGAHVVAVSGNSGEVDVMADLSGRFNFMGQEVSPGTLLFARSGTLATPAGTPVTPSGNTDVHLKLAPDVLSTFRGRVTDTHGKPVPHATVALFRGLPGSDSGTECAKVTTDAQGRYVFLPDYADAGYSLDAEAAGYADKFSKNFTSVAGKTQDVPTLAIARADSFVGGTVVDPQGHPVAGADVSVINIPNLHTRTDTHGRFHLAGVPRKYVILEVQAPEARWTSIQMPSGRDDDVIKVESPAEQQAEGKRFEAMLMADTTNHGDGTNAVTLLHAAEARAARTGRKVFLVFHASWCGPCFVLHRFLEDPKVRPIMDAHFVVQDVDIWEKGDKKKWENPGGTEIYKHYDGPNSVPYFVVLNAQGQKLGDSMHNGQNMGVPTEPDDIDTFFTTLRAAAPSLTAANFATLRAALERSAQF